MTLAGAVFLGLYSGHMSSIRLFVLGALDRRGPMHGHQIRRTAEQERTERWADVTVGALYGALKRMAADGSIEVHATERDGNLPSRTVYAITDRGRDELAAIREEVLRDTRLRPDPIDLALQYSDDLSTDALVERFEGRRLALVAELDSWRDLLEMAKPHLEGLEPVIVRHRQLRLEAEIAWHEEVLEQLERARSTARGTTPDAR